MPGPHRVSAASRCIVCLYILPAPHRLGFELFDGSLTPGALADLDRVAGMTVLGAVGLGAVWGWLLVMIRPGTGRITGMAAGVSTLAPGGLALVYGGSGGLLGFVVAAAGFAGLHVGGRWWLAKSLSRTRRG
jgi:hypothetical protein